MLDFLATEAGDMVSTAIRRNVIDCATPVSHDNFSATEANESSVCHDNSILPMTDVSHVAETRLWHREILERPEPKQ